MHSPLNFIVFEGMARYLIKKQEVNWSKLILRWKSFIPGDTKKEGGF